MTIGELLDELKAGVPIREIAGRLGVDQSTTLQRKLKRHSYRYNQRRHVWEYTGKGEEPLGLDILKDRGSKQTVKKDTTTTPQQPKSKTTATTQQQDSLTAEEIAAIRALLKQQTAGKETTANAKDGGQTVADLFSLVLSLPQDSNKARRTFFIPQDIAQRLDALADASKLNKSDIVAVALVQAFDRFGV